MIYVILEGLFTVRFTLFLLGAAWVLLRSWKSPRRYGLPFPICLIDLGLALAHTVYTRLTETTYLGKAYEMAYLPAHLGRNEFAKQLGVNNELISVNNPQVSMAERLVSRLAATADNGKIDEAVAQSIWDELKKRMPSHMMGNYLRKLV